VSSLVVRANWSAAGGNAKELAWSCSESLGRLQKILFSLSKCQVVCLGAKLLDNKAIRLNLIVKMLSRANQLLSEFRLVRDCVALLLPPDLKEVVSEQLKLPLQSGIVLTHSRNVLLKRLNFSLWLLGQMELKNFYPELHLEIVVERYALIFLLLDPLLDLFEILRVEEGLAREFVVGLGILDSNAYVVLCRLDFLDVALDVFGLLDGLDVDLDVAHFLLFWLLFC
jgi:hypothetical protein